MGGRLIALLIVAVALIVSGTLLGGCYIVNVAPFHGRCVTWQNGGSNPGGDRYVLAPCPAEK